MTDGSAEPSTGEAPTTPFDAFEALDAIAPELETLAREAEELRRPPEAMAKLLRRAKVPWLKVPREVGGLEMTPSTQLDYFARFAYANPTAGWIAFNQSGAAGLAAAVLPDEGVQEIFGSTPLEAQPLFAAVSAPSGHTTACDGGHRLSGRWAYASGATIADWILLMNLCDDPAGMRIAVIRADEVEIHDDWNVGALQGTGSVDLVAEDVFVPEHRSAQPFEPRRGGPMYSKIGFRGYVGGENVGFSLGVAERLRDEIAKLSTTKKRALDSDPVSSRGAFQQELARCDMTLRAARALVAFELDAAMARAKESDAAPGEAAVARLDASIGWATESIVQAATRLFPYAGAGALHLSNPIQRSFRDLVGSGQHLIATNETLEAWARVLLDEHRST
jgi:alkylation response protein AidB-like acyl-CoA dehydrogenase